MGPVCEFETTPSHPSLLNCALFELLATLLTAFPFPPEREQSLFDNTSSFSGMISLISAHVPKRKEGEKVSHLAHRPMIYLIAKNFY